MNSYKESLSALSDHIEQGFRGSGLTPITEIPLADGGKVLSKRWLKTTAGRIVHVEVTGPLRHRVNAFLWAFGAMRVPRS